jgi:mono/diheme cytochrome c family protein
MYSFSVSMSFSDRPVRFTFLALGIVFAALSGLLLLLPQLRWRLEVARLKATGALPDIGWRELYDLDRRGDPFHLWGLALTLNPYLAIKNPFTSAEDVRIGEKLFQSNCTQCHGANGIGGTAGPALKQRQMHKGGSDWAVIKTISEGIAGTSMPASVLAGNDRWRVVAYVKSLAQGVEAPLETAAASRLAVIGSVRYEDILAGAQDPHRWLTYSGSYDGHRFSPNDQITTANVSRLR